MAAKFTMILCAALISVAFAMPAAQQTQVTPKETMKTAETSHLRLPFSFGFGAAYPVARYSPFAYRGISIGFGSEIGNGYPYYNQYGNYYADDYQHYLAHY
ncbi:uncharacterized protein LOC112693521 [Sipha flava]|uniref:Uncharacterized protein LOC112693521 n=2 Tax=Sipha flava TaxID=143950 RepID=A0A8B8GP90_9HEMI|nr:uncharacterized protein LOC112693521 [Sipha flava]